MLGPQYPSTRGQGSSRHRVLLTAATCTLVLQAAAENAALRALKQAQLAAQKEADVAAKKAELQAAAADPWLNEDPQQAASALSPVRVSTGYACICCAAFARVQRGHGHSKLACTMYCVPHVHKQP